MDRIEKVDISVSQNKRTLSWSVIKVPYYDNSGVLCHRFQWEGTEYIGDNKNLTQIHLMDVTEDTSYLGWHKDAPKTRKWKYIMFPKVSEIKEDGTSVLCFRCSEDPYFLECRIISDVQKDGIFRSFKIGGSNYG